MHCPVLLQEVIDGLGLKPGEVFVDATINRGGHSQSLCGFLGSTGELIGIDQDNEALVEAEVRLRECPCPTKLLRGNFRDLKKLLTAIGIKQIDALLFDLGMSREQLEISGRGFSFSRDEPLIMTFASKPPAKKTITAAAIVNSWSEKELQKILADWGEESFASRIAKAIVVGRREKLILTTGQLVEIIARAVPAWYRHKKRYFATKTFQALRIAVNDELAVLKEGLRSGWSILRPGGRLAVISFHGLEARSVKNFFQEQKTSGRGKILTKKAIKPTREELVQNHQARSAQLRIIQKL